MSERAPLERAVARESALAALLLTALYLLFRQRTWSLDGALHTLASVRATDDFASGHVLLRPVAFLWTKLAGMGGPLTFAQRYDALELLFGVLGIAAIVLMFAVVRRRVSALPAWIALAGVAMMRCTERQITDLDEKPLGLFLFALAVTVTDRTLTRLTAGPRERDPALADVLPMGLAWVLAVAGHLQNAPFAVAGTLALVAAFQGPGRFVRAAALLARLVPVLLLAGIALLALIHVGAGGWAALPRLAEHLLVHRPAPPEAPTLLALGKSALMGWVKAFFLVDRFSGPIAVAAAPMGFVALAAAVALGVRRRAEPLVVALVAGSLGLMLLIPAANFFPDYGDSYTMIVLALFLPLAAAPVALVATVTAAVLAINTPAAMEYSWPQTTVQSQLERMIVEQDQRHAPWVLLDELRPFDLEHGLAPVYYRMNERLRVVEGSLSNLPRGAFLIEMPQPIGPQGQPRTGRAAQLARRLEERRRTVRVARFAHPLLTVRSDFRRYGEYLIVEPVRSRR